MSDYIERHLSRVDASLIATMELARAEVLKALTAEADRLVADLLLYGTAAISTSYGPVTLTIDCLKGART